MRAAVHRRFGGPGTVRIEQVPRPRVGRDDVLIRVHASSVSAVDHRARHRDVPHGPWPVAAFGIGTFRPRRRALGMDVAVALDWADKQTPSRPCADVDPRGGSGVGHEPPPHRADISACSGEIV